MDFLWIFVFIYEESGLDCEFKLGWEMDESVDFSRVWRYWVRYFDFDKQVVKMLNFTVFLMVLS